MMQRLNRRLATTIFLVTLALALAAAAGPAAGLAAAPGAGPEITSPYLIQGAGNSSPLARQRVNTLGLVTAATAQGFYLQDPAGDSDPQTSDALYVYTRTPPALTAGQCVLVRDAAVQEFYGKTELSQVNAVELSDACPAVQVIPVPLPPMRLGVDPTERFEPYEGMLVTLDGLDGFVHGPTKHFVSGEEEVAFLDVKLQPAVRAGRVFHTDAASLNALQYLSNALGAQLPAANWGDRLLSADAGRAPVTGILDYNFGKYQLLPLPHTALSTQPGQAQAETGLPASEQDFTVCTFNLYGMGRGSEQYPDAVRYDAEIARRARLIAETLAGCTVIGLQESGTPADTDALAAHLAKFHNLPYRAVALPGPNTDDAVFPLTNSFLLRSDRVQLLAASSRQGCSPQDYDVAAMDEAPCPPGQFPLFNRPPLVVDLAIRGAWGDEFLLRVIDNHWKSKSGDERINAARRLEQARTVAALIQEQGAKDAAAHVIVLGDLNDFTDSPPVRMLTDAPAGLVNAEEFLAPTDRYTYIFNGASQTLDHILISPDMVQLLSGVDAVHANADFASGGSGLQETGRQVSDHDPLVVRIRPQGAAGLAGNAAFAGVLIGLKQDGSEQPAAVTDARGNFRIWNVTPGDVSLHYLAPAWLDIEQPTVALTLRAGITATDDPGAHHHAAKAAARAAGSMPIIHAAQEP